jgi:hypothetical protein
MTTTAGTPKELGLAFTSPHYAHEVPTHYFATCSRSPVGSGHATLTEQPAFLCNIARGCEPEQQPYWVAFIISKSKQTPSAVSNTSSMENAVADASANFGAQ